MKRNSAVFGSIFLFVFALAFAIGFIACDTDSPARDYFIVTFDRNGGDTPANPQTVKVWPDDPYVGSRMPALPTKSGYIFDGWWDEDEMDFDKDTLVYKDMTVKAQWEEGAVAVSKNGARSTGYKDIESPKYDALQHALDDIIADYTGSTATYTVRIGGTESERILNSINLDKSGLKVILERTETDVTIKCDGDYDLFKIDNNAELTLRTGITLTGETNGGTGVLVGNGTFTMEGGIICGFKDSGVKINNAAGKFTMLDGTINYNNADYGAGVYNTGTFIMNGVNCVIGKNTAVIFGGGVYNNGTFTMNAGTINNNDAPNGAGIYNLKIFTMDGINCSITENTAAADGGGVYVFDTGTFTMNNGIISANQAGNGAGVRNCGNFYMNDGIISLNIANANGGGVATNASSAPADFAKTNGVIYGSFDGGANKNEANLGSAVYVYVNPKKFRESTVSESLSFDSADDEKWEFEEDDEE